MKKNNPSSLIRLAKMMKPYMKYLYFVFFCVLVSNLGVLVKPYLVKIIIDDFLTKGLPQNGIYSITGLGISYFLVVLISAGFTTAQRRTLARFGQAILHKLRADVMDHILHMPIKTLDRYGSGRLITRATNDVETLNEFYSDILVTLFQDILLLISLVFMMIQMDWQLALVAFIGIPIIALITISIRKVLKRNFELMKAMIEAGAAAVHFEDQLASVKKCGHMGGKVLVPTQEAIQKLVAARLAADVMGVPTLVIARTDADAADLITSDCDPYDREFITGDRTSEGFFRTHAGIEQAISRGLAYAPYADLVWCETSKPDLEQARRFAEAIHARFPGKLLAYNCSPSFNWKKNLDDKTIASFQQQLSDMGYKYQFITLAGIHSMWFNMFDLAHAYAQGEGMRHYVEKVQQPEFAAGPEGYTFVSHQQEVGTGYFDKVTTIIQGGTSSVTALTGSTEEEQF